MEEKQQEQAEERKPRDLLAQSPEKGAGGFDFLYWLLRFDLLEGLFHLGHVVRASRGISFQHTREVVLQVFGNSACTLWRDTVLQDLQWLFAGEQGLQSRSQAMDVGLWRGMGAAAILFGSRVARRAKRAGIFPPWPV